MPILDAVYAAVRPQNLRTVNGYTTYGRGEGDIRFVYELVNASPDALVVPLTTAFDQPAYWIGTLQGWIERLGPDRSLDACLPGIGRKGTWYGAGGYAARFPLSPSDAIRPGQGLSTYAHIPAAQVACFPVGEYRFHLEYKPLDAGLDDVIAEAAIDFELRDAVRSAAISGSGIPGRATLELAENAVSGRSSMWLNGLRKGAVVSSEIRAAACGSDGPLVVAPPTFEATLGGTYRQRRDFSIHDRRARDAIVAGGPLSIRVTVDTLSTCAVYEATSLERPANVPPTAWPGALLADELGDGRVVRASSETFYGRPLQAFDGNTNNMWNASRFPPAWVELDLGENTAVTGIRLMPSQLPNVGRTVHRVYGRADGAMTEALLHEFAGVTEDATWISAALSPKGRIRYLRIETVESPSWVAWREIVVDFAGQPVASVMPEGTHDGSTYTVAAGDRCYANGWASDPDDRSADVTVRILVDGSAVWTGTAGDYRPDLKAAGIGDGTAGFWVDLRGLLTLGDAHEVCVQARDRETGRWVDLNLTPRTISCT